MADAVASRLTDFWESFRDLLKLPRAFWYVVGAFVVECMAYFGVLTLMTTYLSSDLGWGDARAGITVSVFTMLVTLFMLGVGSYAERFGLRRAILFALGISVLGRVLYSSAAGLGSTGAAVAVIASVVVVAMGSSILQPVCYSGVKQYTDLKTNSMGYGLIYALMNLGIVGIGALSAWLRPAVQNLKDGKPSGAPGEAVLTFFSRFSGTGVQAVNWACVGITALTFILFLMLMTRRAEAAKVRPDTASDSPAKPTLPLGQRLKEFFAGGPFSNPRFIFFIFMLLPVRTLFAHQWLTMPQYILRAYPQGVADRMEWLVNWINPAIIFVGVPVATALTRRVNVYTMMVLGSLVSALPTFLLAGGPSLGLLITYLVIFSIGEALWSARFLEYASELAPPGRIAQYMGLANIPWLLAKGTTGLYSGWMLSRFCPPDTPPEQMHTGALWFIYGCIALSSPLGLWLARKWVQSGLDHRR
ncbi:MAG TPA: MFS transporter [Candidatus Paceibacterota bacterium]|nr:MFS transporter [Candidatus Paceibacterota bacterium]